MDFSIIIPVYNVEKYLSKCLDSVISQTYNDYEVICVNDGSTDSSILILKEYAQKYPQIKIITQKNEGLSGARNAGIVKATGDYIFFLDSDDWIKPDALEILSGEIKDEEDLVCFNGMRYLEDGKTEEPDEGIVEDQLTGWEYYNKYVLAVRKFHFVCVVLRIHRRQFLLQNKLFFKEGRLHEDYLFTTVACYYARSVKVIKESLYYYRIRPGSISQTNSFTRIKDTCLSTNELSAFFVPIQTINKQSLYKVLASAYINIFLQKNRCILSGQKKIVYQLVDFGLFKKVCITRKHKFMYLLIRIYPGLFRFYMLIARKLFKLTS